MTREGSAKRNSGIWRVLILGVGFVLYGSLYPWDFVARPLPETLASFVVDGATRNLDRFLVRDVFVNILLYVPVGASAALALPPKWPPRWRFSLAVLAGLVLSALVEGLQYITPARSSNVLDVLVNGVGTGVGGALGLRVRGIAGTADRLEKQLSNRTSPGGVLLLLWVGFHLAPAFPVLSRTKLLGKVEGLSAPGAFSAVATFASAAEWLAVGAILATIAPWARTRRWLGGLLLLLPARLLLEGRTLTASELVGGLLGVGVWTAGLDRWPLRSWLVPSLLVGALVVTGLEPFSWSQAPGRFAWIPFAGSLEAEPAAGLTVLLQKGFRYGAAVWLLCLAGVPARWAAGGVATVLAGVELAQTHLPGRTAEITDPLIALLMAWGFNQLSRRDSKPSGSVARASIVPSSAGEREVERSAG